MSAELEALVERLEQIDIGSFIDDPDALGDLLAERQTIITAIACVDPTGLPTEERAALKQRLTAVEARDQDILAQLYTLRDELRKAMETMTSGRAAVRGYGGQVSAPESQVRRIG